MLTLPRAAATALLSAAVVLAAPGVANAHSLDSSTLSVRVSEDSVDATVSVALEAVDAALGTSHATSNADVSTYADDVISYLSEHLTVTGADGAVWAERWSAPVRESVEGIQSFSVEVALDPDGADPSAFTVAYDAVIDADAGHEAVVVLTDAAGHISTAGVITALDNTLQVGQSTSTGVSDMVGYGLHHVLEGADHLLFLVTLLLVAPLAAHAGRWAKRDGALPTARRVLLVATTFTVGHSLTLLASALGWVSLPSTPVEVVIALSVAVSAVHAIRPLVRHGEEVIALGFGLVHGLAFAGILADLGIDGSASLVSLLAFNIGVELAQVVTIAAILPSLHLASRTRWYPLLRVGVASVAVAAALGWALDRLGVLANPLAGLEDAAVAHLWLIAAALAVTAVVLRALERVPSARSEVAGTSA